MYFAFKNSGKNVKLTFLSTVQFTVMFLHNYIILYIIHKSNTIYIHYFLILIVQFSQQNEGDIIFLSQKVNPSFNVYIILTQTI